MKAWGQHLWRGMPRDVAGPQAAVSNPSKSPWHQEHMAHTIDFHRQSGHKPTVRQIPMGSPMLIDQLRSKGSIGRYNCFKPGKQRGWRNWDLRFSLTFLHLFYGSAFPEAELITWAWCKSLEGQTSSWERDHVLHTVGGCVVWSFSSEDWGTYGKEPNEREESTLNKLSNKA